ncbi:hypothetical protein, partial [[Clostridium] innocuum]|uniref:hypothetical protein n=1 Tax=Clostridium innocuum TaxID=1522 RepID=UPI0019595B0D
QNTKIIIKKAVIFRETLISLTRHSPLFFEYIIDDLNHSIFCFIEQVRIGFQHLFYCVSEAICNGLDICPVVNQKRGMGVPLRYNNDKRKKP